MADKVRTAAEQRELNEKHGIFNVTPYVTPEVKSDVQPPSPPSPSKVVVKPEKIEEEEINNFGDK